MTSAPAPGGSPLVTQATVHCSSRMDPGSGTVVTYYYYYHYQYYHYYYMVTSSDLALASPTRQSEHNRI